MRRNVFYPHPRRGSHQAPGTLRTELLQTVTEIRGNPEIATALGVRDPSRHCSGLKDPTVVNLNQEPVSFSIFLIGIGFRLPL